MFYIADIFTMGVQYGLRTELCDMLTSAAFKEDPWSNLGKYADSRNVHVQDYDAYLLANTTYDMYKNIRQWTYQYCTEFGWF